MTFNIAPECKKKNKQISHKNNQQYKNTQPGSSLGGGDCRIFHFLCRILQQTFGSP